jgi:O-antigen/teichoic acid export membrane protein
MPGAARVSAPTIGANVLRALLGQVAPAIAAVAAFPFLLRGLGTDGLGILHVTWAVVGYFSLLDIGLGRALTHAVASRLAQQRLDDLGRVVFTGCAALTILGVVGAAVFGAWAGWLARTTATTDAIRADALWAFRLVALAVPLVTVASGARGVLEAQQRFDLVNRVRVPTGVLLYLGPALVLPFSSSVAVASGVAVAIRAAGAVALVALVYRHTPVAAGTWAWSSPALRGLFASGIWMSAANLIGTATQFADRVALTTLVSVTAVAFYATPLDVISRLSIISASITAVTFPVFSARHAADSGRTDTLAVKSAAYTLLAVFPAVLAIAALAPELLTWWMGAPFARESVFATRLIAFGTLANVIAQTPFALLQATGRAKATARIAAAELPVYALGLWVCTRRWGIDGVAMAWTVRMVADAAAHFWLARDVFGWHVPEGRRLLGAAATAAAALVVVSLPDAPLLRLLVAGPAGAAVVMALARVIPAAEVAGQARRVLGRAT